MPSKRDLAREMRRQMTPAEARLWAHLRRNGLSGLHFRRQHVVAGFIADFYCHAARLVVEVDGPIHQRLTDNDAARDVALESAGIAIVHITNAEVMEDIDGVLNRIQEAARP